MVTGWLLGLVSGLLVAMAALYAVAFAGRRGGVVWDQGARLAPSGPAGRPAAGGGIETIETGGGYHVRV